MSNGAGVYDVKSPEVDCLLRCPSVGLRLTIGPQRDNDKPMTISIEPTSGPTEIIEDPSHNFRVEPGLASTANMTCSSDEVNTDKLSVSSSSVSSCSVLHSPFVSLPPVSSASATSTSECSMSVCSPFGSSRSIWSASVASPSETSEPLVSSRSIWSASVTSSSGTSEPFVSSRSIWSASVTSSSETLVPFGSSSSISSLSGLYSPFLSLPPISVPQQLVRATVTPTQLSSHDFADPPRQRTRSMPNMHVWFGSADVENGPSRELIESSETGNVCAITLGETAVHAASSRRCDTTEPVTEDLEKPKRKSMWKRTKRIVRRLFCCA